MTEPDLWAPTPADPVDGDRIRAEREAIRATVEGIDARRQALIAKARAAGWVAHLVGPGQVRFVRWGQARDVIGDDEATAFVERIAGDSA